MDDSSLRLRGFARESQSLVKRFRRVPRFEPLSLPGQMLVRPRRFEDERGFYSEVWPRRTFQEFGLDFDWCQDNHSLSHAAGTLRRQADGAVARGDPEFGITCPVEGEPHLSAKDRAAPRLANWSSPFMWGE